MKLRYFAWVRERVGRGEEERDLPPDVGSVADLVAWLKTQGEEYEAAFAHDRVVRAAVDRIHVKANASILGAQEVAFFPPMTGG